MGGFALPRRLSLKELSRSTTFYAFIGFFCFYLYTRIDSLTSNGVSNHLIEYTPAPYDVFSFGMLCSLFVIAISVRARAVCCEFVPLAVAATLLAISPLYAVVGMPHAVALALAFLGGAGKGIVVLHLGRMLSMLDISASILIVSSAVAIVRCGGFFLPSQPVIFPVVALLSAPLCAIGVFRAYSLLVESKEGFSSCGQLFRGNLNRSPVGLGLALLLVLIASVASVVCPTFAQEALKNSGVSAPEDLVALCGVIACAAVWMPLVAPPRNSRRLVAFCKVMPIALGCCVLLSVCPYEVAFLPYIGVAAGDAMFLILFWIIAPFTWGVCKGRMANGGLFSALAFAECLGISAGFMLFSRETSTLAMAEAGAYAIALLPIALILFVLPEYIEFGKNEAGDTEKGGLTRGESDALRKAAMEAGLSPREFEVLLLLARGRDSKTIQKKLGIAPSTASTHIQRIYKKMGLHSKQDIIDLIDCGD